MSMDDDTMMGSYAEFMALLEALPVDSAEWWRLWSPYNTHMPDVLDDVQSFGSGVLQTPLGNFRVAYEDVKDVFAWADWVARGGDTPPPDAGQHEGDTP